MPRLLTCENKKRMVRASTFQTVESCILWSTLYGRIIPTLLYPNYFNYASYQNYRIFILRLFLPTATLSTFHRQRGFPSATSRPPYPAMIGTSKPEYWFIRLCIVGLHYISPLCIGYCVLLVYLYGFKATKYRFPLLVETGAVLETLFYFLVYLPYNRYLQRKTAHPPLPSREERRELFSLCNDNITDCEGYLRKWFLGADINEIKRENLKDFLLWAFFNRGGLPGDDDDELEEYVSATEKLLGRPIEEGRGSAQALRLTLDKVDMLHRSLIWYFVRLSFQL